MAEDDAKHRELGPQTYSLYAVPGVSAGAGEVPPEGYVEGEVECMSISSSSETQSP